MNHRSYRGKMLYLTDDIGETGREWFHVTIQPDGTRTMRATCEMDDDHLLRDVTMTVDNNWYPVDAFVRLSIEERLVGTSWFHFTENTAECQGFTANEGRVSQHFETKNRIGFFGAHQLHGDAWGCATLKRDENLDSSTANLDFSSSHLPNGGSGPLLVPSQAGFTSKKFIGKEQIEVPAGNFETRHFQFLVADYPPIDIWTLGSDFIPVRLRWNLLKQSYDLVELEGDPA
ncbi:MAG: DUF3108 domain-containing protein [Gammaproteobacteria bacterium]|nr:DUF3108 domain-containing protein [Gammaproteobacteria bacterium]